MLSTLTNPADPTTLFKGSAPTLPSVQGAGYLTQGPLPGAQPATIYNPKRPSRTFFTLFGAVPGGLRSASLRQEGS